MVSDLEIKKVALICDEVYARKADGRAGGVGTETQIISQQVYESQDQNKFVAVVTEKDSEGNLYLPAYYKSKICIDLSEKELCGDKYDQLVRWVYDKPLYKRPKIGKKPSFLENNEGPDLETSALYRRAISCIKDAKPYANVNLEEYLNQFSKNIENFRIIEKKDIFDQQVVDSIDDFQKFKNEYINILSYSVKYINDDNLVRTFHRFFESLIPYMYAPEGVYQYTDSDLDNFLFIIYELFISTVAFFIKVENFKLLNQFLKEEFYVQKPSEHYGRDMVKFTVFCKNFNSLDKRKKRLSINLVSIETDLIIKNTNGSLLDRKDIIQADICLFIRSHANSIDFTNLWYPMSILYMKNHEYLFPIEIFSRSRSRKYFDELKGVLSISCKEDIIQSLPSMNKFISYIVGLSNAAVDFSKIINYENIGVAE